MCDVIAAMITALAYRAAKNGDIVSPETICMYGLKELSKVKNEWDGEK